MNCLCSIRYMEIALFCYRCPSWYRCCEFNASSGKLKKHFLVSHLQQGKRRNLVLRHAALHFLFDFWDIAGVEWWEVTPHVTFPGRVNENIKYLISLSGNRKHNLSCLQSHACAPIHLYLTNKKKSHKIKLFFHGTGVTVFKNSILPLFQYFWCRNKIRSTYDPFLNWCLTQIILYWKPICAFCSF